MCVKGANNILSLRVIELGYMLEKSVSKGQQISRAGGGRRLNGGQGKLRRGGGVACV